MNLDLKELGITLIVGAFTILGLEAILYQYFSIQLTGFFQRKPIPRRDKLANAAGSEASVIPQQDKESFHSIRILVFIGMAFGIGILAEDLSYKYVDSVQTPFQSLPARLNSILPTELQKNLSLPSKESSRVKALINDFATKKTDVQPLGLDLARHAAFEKLYSGTPANDGKRFDDWIIRVDKCKVTKSKQCKDKKIRASDCNWYDDTCPLFDASSPPKEEIETAIYSLYYFAKNNAYLHTTYYDELRRIETRRDFSRSIGLIAYIYAAGALILGLGRTLFILRKYVTSRHKINQRSEVFRKVIPVWLVLFCIYFFSMWAYERESDEFNKRAFGYYSAMLIGDGNKPDRKKPSQPGPTLKVR